MHNLDATFGRTQSIGSRLCVDFEPLVEKEDGLSISFEETVAIRLILERVSEAAKRLLHLRFWEGRSIQSITDELGIRYSAAAVRLFRLLPKLREQLNFRAM